MSEDEPERLVLEEADVQVEEVDSPSPIPDEAHDGMGVSKSEFDTIERCVMDDFQAPLCPQRVQSGGSTAGLFLHHTLSEHCQVDVMTKEEMLFHLNSLEARLVAEMHSHSISLLDKLEGKLQKILEERDDSFAEKLEGLVAAVSGNMVSSFKSSEISGQSGPLPELGQRPQPKTSSGMVTFQQPSDPISGRHSAHGSQRSLREDPREEAPAAAAAPPETRPPQRVPVARVRHFKMQSIEEVSDALSDRLMEQDSLRAAGLEFESSSSERCAVPVQHVSTEGVQGSRHLLRPPPAARNRSSGVLARQVSPGAVIQQRSKSAGLPSLAANGTKSLLQAFRKTLSLGKDREDKDSPSGRGGAKQQDAIIVPSHDSDEDNLPGSIRPRGEALGQIEEENDSGSLPRRSNPASQENIPRLIGEAAVADAPQGSASGVPARSPSGGPAKSSSLVPGKSGSVVVLGKSGSMVLGKSSSVLPDRSSSVAAGKSPSYVPSNTCPSSHFVPQGLVGQPAGASSMVGMEKPARANSVASGNVGKPKALAQSNSGVFGPAAGHTLSVMYQLPPDQNGVNPMLSRVQSVQGSALSPMRSRGTEGAGPVKSRVTYVDMEELRRQTEGMILQNDVETKKTASLAVIGEHGALDDDLSFTEVLVALLSRAPLYINGIVPVSNSRAAVVYQSFCLAGAVALPAYYISTLATSPPTEGVWIELIYAGATALGLSSLWWHRIKNLVGDHPKSLDVYADNHGFSTIWHQKSLRHLACILTLWVGEVIIQLLVAARPDALEDFVCEDGNTENRFVRLIPALICGIIFMVLCYSVAHFSSVLGLMIDNFCTCFGETADVPKGVQDWNVLQAILRKTALTLDTCIVMLQTSVAAGLLFMGAAVLVGGLGTEACGHRWWMIGLARVMIKFLMVAFCSSIAANVSQKCARAPPLVNSIIANAGLEVDTHRSYLVSYMRNSEAGFYIKGVRFTFIEVMKASYLAAVGVFWIVLQLRNKSPL